MKFEQTLPAETLSMAATGLVQPGLRKLRPWLALCCLSAVVSCSSDKKNDAEKTDGSVVAASPATDAGADSGTAAQARAWKCFGTSKNTPDFLPELGCEADFLALASEPLQSAIPGARAVKTSIDRDTNSELSFQNSQKYPIHWEFVSAHRSVANGLPRVPSLAEFNQSEYYSPSRRFILGSLTHYEGPDEWVYEVSPYDTASA
ncbi:MAG: hypothetical protein RJA70_1155, partial [Pseudomonadota bacterium]